MDPLHAGEHCALQSCKQLDFLPFVCDHCQAVFCKEHCRPEDHSCPNIKQDSQAGGGGKSSPPPSHSCWVEGCRRREQVEVRCAHCLHTFCLVHRHKEDHDCSLVSTLARPSARHSKPVRQEYSASKRPAGGRVGARSEALSAKVALMKLKMRAEGPASVPQSERVYYEVKLPDGSKVQSASLFFSKEWSVGKVIDTISQKYGLRNHNDQSHAQKLLLQALDGVVLQPSRSLQSYLDLIPAGSSLTLFYQN